MIELIQWWGGTLVTVLGIVLVTRMIARHQQADGVGDLFLLIASFTVLGVSFVLAFIMAALTTLNVILEYAISIL